MATCSTCRFWLHTDDHGNRYDPEGVCSAAVFVDRGYGESHHIPPDGIGCCDGSGYWGQVITGPEFWCRKWEGK